MRVQDKTAPIILWQISDGKRGHVSQSTGLINALRRHVPAEVHVVETPPLNASLYSCLTRRTGWAQHLPAPRAVIGAGHATHLPMLVISRAHRAKTVVIMRPSLPLGWFDYCLVPAHDNPPARDNVIITQGAVNLMQPGETHNSGRGLILIGGTSPHYGFDTGVILSQIKQVLARSSRQRWTVCNSPRTPAGLNSELSGLKSTRVDVMLWDRCERDWLANELHRARDVWVTEDSISMIYEALTAGCHVGLLPLARKAASRLHQSIEQLLRERFVTSLSDWLDGGNLTPPQKSLDEAGRCARLLLDKGLLTG